MDLTSFVKPLYNNKDSMHNFNHVLRIKRKVALLKKGYKVDEGRLYFLVNFHGLKDFVKQHEKVLLKSYPKSYLISVYRHTSHPVNVEEKLVSDANLLESVGRFGIKKALRVGKERRQTKQQTLNYMRKNIKKIRFYTKLGKKQGNPGIKVIKQYLKKHC